MHFTRVVRSLLRRQGVGAALFLGAGTVLVAGTAWAYTATLNPASPKEIYFQVGTGTFTGCYTCATQGTPGINTTINKVTATLAVGTVGNGTAQAMTTDSTATTSYWDNYTYCSVPGQLYIGGFYRTTSYTTTTAQVTATVPAALVNATGATIPFSTIHWTSSGIGDTGSEPFPAGTFVNGGTQTVGAMSSNTWNESCWSFSYTNATVVQGGAYTGRVTYTMSAP